MKGAHGCDRGGTRRAAGEPRDGRSTIDPAATLVQADTHASRARRLGTATGGVDAARARAPETGRAGGCITFGREMTKMKGGLFSALQNKSAQSALAAGACGLNAAKTDAPAARSALASGPRAPSARRGSPRWIAPEERRASGGRIALSRDSAQTLMRRPPARRASRKTHHLSRHVFRTRQETGASPQRSV